MPNIKSAIKRVDVTIKKNLENKAIKSRIATYTKKFKKAVEERDLENAASLLAEVISYIDCAAKDNVIHKNNANRKKATLTKLLDNAKK